MSERRFVLVDFIYKAKTGPHRLYESGHTCTPGSLDQFGGTIDMFFETTGLICRLSLVLPESTASVVPDIAEVLAAD
jgi:hypothetical protein